MKLTVKDKEGNIIGSCDITEADKNLLDILTDNDIVVPASCKMGVCGVCLCTIEAGAELLIKKDVMPTEDDMCLLCTTYINPELEGEIIVKLVN